MEDLIKALTILLKYGNPHNPTHCEHDELTISPDIKPESVSEEDKKALKKFGFNYDQYSFKSYRYGSC